MNLSQSKESIQENILNDFQKAAKKFYKQIETDYLEDLRKKMRSGDIDVSDDNIRELSEKYAAEYEEYIKKSQKVENFIKKYINDTFDLICDAMSENLIEREEAEEAFLALKHILTAGKMHIDKTAKRKKD